MTITRGTPVFPSEQDVDDCVVWTSTPSGLTTCRRPVTGWLIVRSVTSSLERRYVQHLCEDHLREAVERQYTDYEIITREEAVIYAVMSK